MKIFEQQYCSEELADLSRDIYEVFDPDFNPVVKQIPTDEFCFHRGSFTVTVVWNDEN